VKLVFPLILIVSGQILAGCGQGETSEDKAFFSQMSTKNPPRSKGGPKINSAADTEKVSKANDASAPATGAPPATGK